MVNKGTEFQGVSGWDGSGEIKLFRKERSRCVSEYWSITWLTFNQSWILDGSDPVLFPYWGECVVKNWGWGNWGNVDV